MPFNLFEQFYRAPRRMRRCIGRDLITSAVFASLVFVASNKSTRAASLNYGDFVVTAHPEAASLLKIDPITGDRSVISGGTVGAGPEFVGLFDVLVQNQSSLLVVDMWSKAVLQVDVGTGDRTVVSGPSVGNGVTFQAPKRIALEGGSSFLVTDSLSETLFRVDLSTGNRTVVSSNVLGAGPAFTVISDVILERDGFALVSNTGVPATRGSVFRVNLTTGDRELVSGEGVGSGESFGYAGEMLLTRDGRLLVSDADGEVIRAVDRATGDRTIFSGRESVNYRFTSPYSLVEFPENTIVFTDSSVGELSKIDPTTGQKVLISGGGSNRGLGPRMSSPWGMDVVQVPEPGTISLLICSGVVCAANLLRRRRASH